MLCICGFNLVPKQSGLPECEDFSHLGLRFILIVFNLDIVNKLDLRGVSWTEYRLDREIGENEGN